MMKTLIHSLLFVATLVIVLLTANPPLLTAQDEAINDACREAPTSPVCRDLQNRQNPVSGEDGLFVSVFDILSFIAGVIAVIVIVIGGIQMMTSDGDSQKFTNARNLLIYAAVGLVIVLFAQAIVKTVINILLN